MTKKITFNVILTLYLFIKYNGLKLFLITHPLTITKIIIFYVTQRQEVIENLHTVWRVSYDWCNHGRAAIYNYGVFIFYLLHCLYNYNVINPLQLYNQWVPTKRAGTHRALLLRFAIYCLKHLTCSNKILNYVIVVYYCL